MMHHLMLEGASRTRRFWLSVLALLALLASALLFGCGRGPDNEEHTEARPAPAYFSVPEDWAVARLVKGHKVHVGQKGIACAKCHELPAGGGVGAVSIERCTPCHEKEARLEHGGAPARAMFGPTAHSDCKLCHAFTRRGLDAGAAPDVKMSPTPAATDCIRCHSQPLGNTPAVTVHSTAACVKCHRVHEQPKPMPLACPECHKDIHAAHGKQGEGDPVAVCTSCHSHPHAEAAVAKASCGNCHFGKDAPHIPQTAIFASGHSECTTCHKAHDFTAQGVKPCRSCHTAVQVLGAVHVRAHQNCASCHSPHDVRGSAPVACANCHKDVHPDHPNRRGSACVGCHDPHPDAEHVGVKALACSECHVKAQNDRSFHEGTACSQCHRPHDFVLASLQEAPCSTCHGPQVHGTEGRTGHHDCKGCHSGLPHHPREAMTECRSCHAAEAERANPGHQVCRNCHEPHSGSLAKPCKSCHETEHASAIPKHPACTTCHEPHSGKQAKPCQSCHTAPANSPHGKLAQGCTSCHAPHGDGGPSHAPACTSCHQTATLPGLHAEAKHATCTNCHSGHDDPKAAPRALCTRCHTDRTRHFPEAPRCIGCHLFTPTK